MTSDHFLHISIKSLSRIRRSTGSVDMVNNATFTAAAMCLIQNIRERNRDGFILELIFGVNPILLSWRRLMGLSIVSDIMTVKVIMAQPSFFLINWMGRAFILCMDTSV